jgi:hypothetical protein
MKELLKEMIGILVMLLIIPIGIGIQFLINKFKK